MERYQQSKHGLGSEILITIVAPKNHHRINSVFDNIWQQINFFEKKFSRFLVDSELSQFNINSGKEQPVSKEFTELLKVTKDMAKKTDGLFNPFILPSLQRSGYKGSWPNPMDSIRSLNFENRELHQANDLVVKNNKAKIPKNSAIDFGGIGKGYLLDRLVETLPDFVYGYWFSMGGDIICGGKDVDSKPWTIEIKAATEDKNIGSVTNTKVLPMAIATSGTTKRRGKNEKGNWHHIINPVTGSPVKNNILTVTVVAERAVEADIFAKTILIIGISNAGQFIDKMSLDGALIQYQQDQDEVATIKYGKIDE